MEQPGVVAGNFGLSFTLNFFGIFVHISGSLGPITLIWASLERSFPPAEVEYRWCQFWSKVMTSEVEEMPGLITAGYGQHRSQWAKFPALATPNVVDCIMKDWWLMTSLQEYLKALCFYFTRSDVRIALPTSFCLFFVEENSSPLLKQQLLELEGFCDSWLDVTTHSETQTLFCTDSRSISLGVADAGSLNQNLRIPFNTS